MNDHDTTEETPCNGICLTGSDIGIPSSQIAYAHPTCPAHGDAPDHPFELAETDGHGHQLCRCGGVRETHWEQPDCTHELVVDSRCHDCGFHVSGHSLLARVRSTIVSAGQRAALATED